MLIYMQVSPSILESSGFDIYESLNSVTLRQASPILLFFRMNDCTKEVRYICSICLFNHNLKIKRDGMMDLIISKHL